MPAPIKPRTQAPHGMSRRDFLTLGTAATGLGAFGLTLPDTALATASAADTNWHAGQLAHLIPAAMTAFSSRHRFRHHWHAHRG